MPVLGRSGTEFSVAGFLFSVKGVAGEVLPGDECLGSDRSFLELKFDFFVPGENIAQQWWRKCK